MSSSKNLAPASGSFLKIVIDQDIAVLTMDRPATRNAISDDDAIDELVGALDAIGRGHHAKAVILTGNGTAFSAGGNLQTLNEFSATPAPQLRDRYREGIQRIPLAFERLEVPTIAAVNGPAVGAGCDLACMCDMRIAAEGASFAESFINLGIVPGDGGAWFLPRVIGMPRAFEMAFTGDPISAQRALEWAMVSQVVPQHELMPVTLQLASRIARHSAPALRMTKRLLREAMHSRLDTLLEMSAGFQAIAHQTPEHQAAIQAMLDRIAAKSHSRPPVTS
jgi:2-(1,2-epoxy-1,2-dihydrophenyl)acetyl-CoA isomerase